MLPPLIENLIAFDFTAFPAGPCRVRAHLHAFHQLDLIVEGAVTIFVEGRGDFHLERGDALFLPPLWKHCLSETSHGFRQASYKFYLGTPYFACFPKEPRLLRLPERIVTAIEASSRARGLPAVAEQVAAGTLAVARFANPEESPSIAADPLRQPLLEILKRVSDQPFRKWSVSDLARMSGMGNETFTRHFLRVLGMTPRRFLVETRIRAAALRLATEPAVPIKEVAAQAGYGTVHSFTRIFRKLTGATPGEVRKTAKIPPVGDKDRRSGGVAP